VGKIDRDLLPNAPADRTELVLAHYNLLSEYAHPNYLDVTYLSGTLDRRNGVWRFGQIDPKKRTSLGQTLGVALL
jgi:hypothetical protein